MLAVLYEEGFSRARIAEELTLRPSDLEQLLFGLAMSQACEVTTAAEKHGVTGHVNPSFKRSQT